MRRVHPTVKPWHVVVVTIATSMLGGALCAAAGLKARGRIHAARRVVLYGLPAGSFLILGLGMQPLAWSAIAGWFLACNVLGGVALAWLLRRTPLAAPEAASTEPRGTGWSVLWGILGGASIASYIGGGAGVLYLLGTDVLVSTVFPSIAGRFTALAQFASLLTDFTLIGAVTGGILGARRPHMHLRDIVWTLLGCVVTYYTAQAAWTLLVGIPTFQAYKLVGSNWLALQIVQIPFWFFLCLASALGALLFADRVEASWSARWRAAGLAVGLVVSGVLSFVLYSGRLSYDLLLAGQLFEKRPRLALAQWCYELGLAQRSDEAISSYLQFRIGLLHRKLGQDPQARTALAKVVTKYTKRQTLVALAQQFLTALEQAPPDAKRYTIPGIETRTEFKAAYCVPNSMGLILRYWRVPISSKTIGRRITSLDFGTTLADALWYVHTQGLQHYIIPLADVEHIKRLLNESVPLLLYIPRHVLAVFGYDEALKSLITYDVAEEDIWVDHPIETLVPQWKHELATLGVVLPPERFAQLPEEEQRRLDRLTRAYTHHELHYPYHQSRDPDDLDRALAHLEASVTLAPEFFFDLAHIYARPRWAFQRQRLAATHDLKAVARDGLAFARYQFSHGEVLPELALLTLDLEDDEALRGFLEERFQEGTLQPYDELVGLLGLLEYRRGQMDAAMAYLTTLRGVQRYPLVLGQAMEAVQSWQAAINEYQRVLEAALDEEEDADTAFRALQVVPELQTDGLDTSLYARRSAMLRIIALADRLKDQERLRTAAQAYVNAFPWDLTVQLRYGESLSAALSRGGGLPQATRAQWTQELTRTVGVLRALDLEGRWRESIDRLEARTEPANPPR